MIVFSCFLARKRRAGDAVHRQAALTPRESTKTDPAGGLARPSVVVARPL
jgi:hypothetical protein